MRRPPDARIHLSTNGDGARNGSGTAKADLSHLFEPFFRADPSRSKRTGGLGLGLSICKRIMEAHGGDIAAENSPDRGLSVVVDFPR